MGLIYGDYDAKGSAFAPGGASLHNCMSSHGPDQASYEKAINEELKPNYYDNTLAFMLESFLPWEVSHTALQSPLRQKDYMQAWQGLPATFKRP